MKQSKSRLPKFGDWLLRHLARYDVNFHLRGDFDEEFSWIYETKGFVRAWFWYWMHLLRSLPVFIKDILHWRSIMIKNYLKTTLRNIKKHKGYSFINLAGLAIGITICLLISLWVLDELSFNRFHKKAKKIYMVTELLHFKDYSQKLYRTVAPMGPTLKEEYPEIVDSARFFYFGPMLLRHEDKEFYEDSIVAVDNSFFKMFDFPFAKGDTNTTLSDPNSVIINETIAEKYFGDSDPIGKVFQANNQYDFTVQGVSKDVPTNSDIQFSIVFPWAFLKNFSWYREDVWDDHNYYTYIMLGEDSQKKEVERKIANIFMKHNDRMKIDIGLQPLTEVHLHTDFGAGRNGMTYVYIISAMAIFVLLIACINFMNLSTARSSYRFKEIGMRKVVGGTRRDIIRQFFSESLILSFISFVIAIILVLLVLPSFNNFVGKHLSLNVINNRTLLAGMFIITFFTGLVAGSYPAFYLSSFKPVNVLKGILQSGRKASILRRVLVVFQFTGSLILIIGTLTIYSQLDYMIDANLGWDKEHLMYITMRGDSYQSYDILKNELKKNIGIQGVAGGTYKPSSFGSETSGVDWAGKDPEEKFLIRYNFVDYDFIETAKIEMVKGRQFSKDFATDISSAYIINEAMAKKMAVESIIGTDFTFWNWPGKIIGVVKDFHFRSLKSEIQPMALMLKKENSWNFRYILLRLNSENIASTTEFIKETWNKIVPDYPLEYNFIDEDIGSMYTEERRMGELVKYSAILAVFVACLGLFGLVSFTVDKRKKEIGIRKVLGASIPTIIRLLSREFIILIIISNIAAWSSAYFIMKQWLNNFPYRIELGIGIFVLSGISALILILFSVSYQAVKAATANPVDSLRYE